MAYQAALAPPTARHEATLSQHTLQVVQVLQIGQASFFFRGVVHIQNAGPESHVDSCSVFIPWQDGGDVCQGGGR